MISKKVNEIFGYGLYIVGVLKILLLILVLTQMVAIVIFINNGVTDYPEYYYTLSRSIGLAQIILAIGSIIMIFVNKKNNKAVILGYLLGLGALAIELITPKILVIFAVIIQAYMYMKAGIEIRNANSYYEGKSNSSKRNIRDTEWFYADKND